MLSSAELRSEGNGVVGFAPRFPVFKSIPEVWIGILYAIAVGIGVGHHEPWADEAQSWLLARDATLVDLWTNLLHLEGTPGLWQSLLHLLIRLGLPYSGLSVFSGLLGLSAAVLFVRYAPFPLAIRALIPFTYFLCFQYAVVARSYSLVPILLFAIAAAYRSQHCRRMLIAVLLALLSMVSAQAFLISLSIAVTFAAKYVFTWGQHTGRSQRLASWAAAGYLVILASIAYAIWPRGNTMFVVSPNFSLANFVGMSRYAFQQAFGPGYWPIVLIGLSVPLLSRGLGLPFFVLASLCICLLGSFIYSNVWHHGFLVLSWLFALWLSAQTRKIGWPALIALSAFLVMQCSWTWKALVYERHEPYSGSRAMAKYMKNNELFHATLFGIGFPSVAVQPYFASGIFRNYGGSRSYWLWSKSSEANDFSERLGSAHPDFVVLGYASESDRRLWAHLITASGYQLIKQFNGNLFWETNVFQPENYELYKAGDHISDAVLASKLKLSDTENENQLLSGFLSGSVAEGRQVNGTFSVALQRPPAPSGDDYDWIDMQFQISDEQIKKNGSLALTGYVSGRPLATMVIHRGGSYTYAQPVARGDLYWAIVPVVFQFEKTGFALSVVDREQVAVVNSIELTGK